MLRLMKLNGCLPLLNLLHKMLWQSHIHVIFYVNELILTPFNPFDIKCKKL